MRELGLSGYGATVVPPGEDGIRQRDEVGIRNGVA